MENKYYTPSIEEFHVGFEYEIEEPDGSYTKQELTVRDSLEFIDDHSSEFRVKYLDIDDIESLGFKESEYKNTGCFILDKYRLFWFGKPFISIDVIFKNEYQIIFRGTIRNKSEFKSN